MYMKIKKINCLPLSQIYQLDQSITGIPSNNENPDCKSSQVQPPPPFRSDVNGQTYTQSRRLIKNRAI